MASADAETTIAPSISKRWINHSFAEKLWKDGLAFASIRCKFSEKNRSSSPKALMVIAPAMDSAKWLATEDLVVPSIRINSFVEAK
ncbi:hypothetical protein LguiB_034784 [Lonicera macranthoides]